MSSELAAKNSYIVILVSHFCPDLNVALLDFSRLVSTYTKMVLRCKFGCSIPRVRDIYLSTCADSILVYL